MAQPKKWINWTSYSILLNALIKSMKTLINISLFFTVFIYMTMIIGMWLFAGKF